MSFKDTNVIPRYIWPAKTIPYKLDSNSDKVELQKLVDMTLDKFKEELGTFFVWEEIEDAYGYNRLVYFKLTNLACGMGHAGRMGGSIVELSTDDQCDVYSYLKNVLTIL
uniref:Uncharacterized protein n=1 Tax=Panagrolaimus sp. ES5 TaxID=591445 RepID=A0AC34FPP8_9BILA